MTYQEKLRDPRWQKRRLEILQRDNFTCKLCGDDKSELHIHHAAYKKGLDPWEYEDAWLHTVCAHCHESAALIRMASSLNLMESKETFKCFDILNALVCMEKTSEALNVLRQMLRNAIEEEGCDEE